MSCCHYGYELSESHRHYVNSQKHNNCVMCLVHDVGPMTQEKVAEYLGVSKMRVSQIESIALKRFRRLMYKENNFTDFDISV